MRTDFFFCIQYVRSIGDAVQQMPSNGFVAVHPPHVLEFQARQVNSGIFFTQVTFPQKYVIGVCQPFKNTVGSLLSDLGVCRVGVPF
jgi:hypothetical protein